MRSSFVLCVRGTPLHKYNLLKSSTGFCKKSIAANAVLLGKLIAVQPNLSFRWGMILDMMQTLAEEFNEKNPVCESNIREWITTQAEKFSKMTKHLQEWCKGFP